MKNGPTQMSDGELQMFRGANQIYGGPEPGLSSVYIMRARPAVAWPELRLS